MECLSSQYENRKGLRGMYADSVKKQNKKNCSQKQTVINELQQSMSKRKELIIIFFTPFLNTVSLDDFDRNVFLGDTYTNTFDYVLHQTTFLDSCVARCHVKDLRLGLFLSPSHLASFSVVVRWRSQPTGPYDLVGRHRAPYAPQDKRTPEGKLVIYHCPTRHSITSPFGTVLNNFISMSVTYVCVQGCVCVCLLFFLVKMIVYQWKTQDSQ